MVPNKVLEYLKENITKTYMGKDPSSLALCAAKARDILGERYEEMEIKLSLKSYLNIRDQIIPFTGSKRGPELLSAMAISCGDPKKGPLILEDLSDKAFEMGEEILKTSKVKIEVLKLNETYVEVGLKSKSKEAWASMGEDFPKFISLRDSDDILEENPPQEKKRLEGDIRSIIDFVTVNDLKDMEEIEALLYKQIIINTEISESGMQFPYGKMLGISIDSLSSDDDFFSYLKAWTASAMDALVGGYEGGVSSLKGSSACSIMASLPLISYCSFYDLSQESLFRGVLLSDLLTSYSIEKAGDKTSQILLGGASAIGAISYLKGADYSEISDVMNRSLWVLRGIYPDITDQALSLKTTTILDNCLMAMTISETANYRGKDEPSYLDIEVSLEEMNRSKRASLYTSDCDD